jgi:hypothetical protein
MVAEKVNLQHWSINTERKYLMKFDVNYSMMTVASSNENEVYRVQQKVEK